MTIASQKTIAETVEISGIGLHTGYPSHMRFHPAAADTGIVFQRSDLRQFSIPAVLHYVSKVSYATSLMKQGVLIATVEHVLSAIHALGIDNLTIEVDTMEIPIADGSAQPFVEVLGQAGFRSQTVDRRFLRLLQPIRVASGEKWMEAVPADRFQVCYGIDFDHPLIGKQEYSFRWEEENYRREIAPARTFGFAEEVEALRQAGLAKGGSLENAVVLNREGVMNREGLRYSDEFVRHKILDLIGDFCLLGKPLLASVKAYRAGHRLHYNLCHRILRDPALYEIVSRDGEY